MSQTAAHHCTIVTFQHHEEISLFEQYLHGGHDIGVLLDKRSLAPSGVLSTFHLVIIARLLS